MQHKIYHNYHIIKPSPWPLILSIAILFSALGFVMIMHKYNVALILLLLGGIFLFCATFFWWRDVIRESKNEQAHTEAIKKGLSIGMILFIVSEIIFFTAFFCSFFKTSLDPALTLVVGEWPTQKSSWPPLGIKTLDPWNIPFLNTMVLLLSGTTITWAHYELINSNKKAMIKALGITITLGFIFTMLQIYEYSHASFKISDGIYPSNFYLVTGFHGIHVIIGTVFLLVCYCRAKLGHFIISKSNTQTHNIRSLGFEFAAWYWHFIDVIWLFLFIFLYVLGS